MCVYININTFTRVFIYTSVVSLNMAPKRYSRTNPGTCECYLTLWGQGKKKESLCRYKIKNIEIRKLFWITGLNLITRVPIKERQKHYREQYGGC